MYPIPQNLSPSKPRHGIQSGMETWTSNLSMWETMKVEYMLGNNPNKSLWDIYRYPQIIMLVESHGAEKNLELDVEFKIDLSHTMQYDKCLHYKIFNILFQNRPFSHIMHHKTIFFA